jgi:hypothetical protein
MGYTLNRLWWQAKIRVGRILRVRKCNDEEDDSRRFSHGRLVPEEARAFRMAPGPLFRWDGDCSAAGGDVLYPSVFNHFY